MQFIICSPLHHNKPKEIVYLLAGMFTQHVYLFPGCLKDKAHHSIIYRMKKREEIYLPISLPFFLFPIIPSKELFFLSLHSGFLEVTQKAKSYNLFVTLYPSLEVQSTSNYLGFQFRLQPACGELGKVSSKSGNISEN